MGYRGRLIWIFTAEVLRLDTAATAENGPGAVGYDHDFREPLKAADGTTSRVYHPAVELDC